MSKQRILHVIVIVLAAIGALAIISALAMWFMHESMMDKMMSGSGFDVASMIYGDGTQRL
jgi:hypothetical protein